MYLSLAPGRERRPGTMKAISQPDTSTDTRPADWLVAPRRPLGSGHDASDGVVRIGSRRRISQHLDGLLDRHADPPFRLVLTRR